jgi:cytochrome c oxidase cbb3-type subunit III
VSNFLSLYIIFLVVLSIISLILLIYYTRNVDTVSDGTGHSFDGITELNEPLPLWWLWLSILSILFSIIYLLFYPGLGKFKGILQWTSHKECNERILTENEILEPIYVSYFKETVEELSANKKALKIGRSLFLNNCALCHGFDAKGGNGFPNLTNNKWLYGGTSNDIKTTITNGRRGNMPSYASVLGSDYDINSTAQYVLSLSSNKNLDISKEVLDKGKTRFSTICSACHGLNAKGNKFIGAPDLTDPQWIYGGSLDNIITTIKNGRNGIMPSHKDILSKEQIHLLTAYIYSLNYS